MTTKSSTRQGKANTNADALSRNIKINIIQNEQQNNAETVKPSLGIIEVESEKDRQQILYEYHLAPLGGHQGIQRTAQRIKQKYKWKGMDKDIEEYIQKCTWCQKNKICKRNKAPMVISDTPTRPFEKGALDIVGPLTITKLGNKYILTFQDHLTKFSKAIPLPNQEARTIAEAFVTRIISEHGIPDKILTDQGSNFVGEVFKNTCKLLKITKIQTTAYHPESNGALERSHRTLVEYLRHYIDGDQTDWDAWLPYAMFTYNTTPHTATGYTPHELVYGQQAELPTALRFAPNPTYNYDDYAQEAKERLRAANETARENLRDAKIRSKVTYDKKTKEIQFNEGDKVLLYDESVRRGRSKKLDSKWEGPYTIIEKKSKVNVVIKKGRKTLTVHTNRIKHFVE